MRMRKSWAYLEHDQALPCPSGENFRIKHTLVRKGNNLFLEEVDKVNIPEYIASFEDGVSLSKMIARYKKTGDMSFLNANSNAFYGDVSGMETNLARVIDNNRRATAALRDMDLATQNNENGAANESGAENETSKGDTVNE